jgi:hypothetical protein
MGVIEAGRPRIVKAAPAPVVGGETPVALGVDLADGIAVGRVDGKPTMFVNFDKGLGAGKFGFQTHGTAVVREMVAHRGGEEVHRVALSTGAVFPLTRGDHTLEVDLVPQGAAVDSVTVKEATR